MSPAKPSDSTLPPEDPAIRRSTISGPGSVRPSALQIEDFEPIPDWVLLMDANFAAAAAKLRAYRCDLYRQEYNRPTAEIVGRKEKCGHSAMICGGIELPMNDDTASGPMFAPDPQIYDGPGGCGDDHRFIVGRVAFAPAPVKPLPPVTVAAPIVEKITESHRQLKLVVHEFLEFTDRIIPQRNWLDDSFQARMAKLINYTSAV